MNDPTANGPGPVRSRLRCDHGTTGVLAIVAVMLAASLAGCAHTAPVTTAPAPTGTLAPAPDAPRTRSPADIPAGTRIRYHVHGDWRGIRHGTVARATADTVWLSTGDPLPTNRLRRLDRSRGGATIERRMAIGSLVGGTIGAVTVAAIRPSSASGERPDRALTAMAVGMYGAVVGGVGALLVPGEKWEKVTLPPRAP